MEWKPVSYGNNNPNIPSERWGHRFVNRQSKQLVLFGGFGGNSSDGKYLRDIWSFSLTTYTWRYIATTGRIPQCRSNYTVHYNMMNDEIIMFGGGTNNKMRFNDVNILNWQTKEWRRYLPEESSQPIWERTYHCSQFSYPYLVVHGGEGVSNIDLEDMWVFNIVSKKWNKIEFDQQTKVRKRRFHASALINGYFYIIGGCTGNYELLGDIYRVNLQKLFERNQFADFTWECMVSRKKMIERWGHSSEVYNGKIYISCGRISSQSDNNDTFCFDPASSQIVKLQIKEGDGPSGRRKHASAIVGNSLLIFGGYNGKYLNDFYYVPLQEPTPSTTVQPIPVQNQRLIEILNEREQQYLSNIVIELLQQGSKVCTLQSNRQMLETNKFFKLLLKHSQESRAVINLPQFCSVNMFRLLNLSIMSGQLLLIDGSKQYYSNLIMASQYFLCSEQIVALEKHLKEILNEHNYLQMLQISMHWGLKDLIMPATYHYLLNQQANNHASPEQIKDHPKIIHSMHEAIRFDFEQKQLAQSNMGFLDKTVKTIKALVNKKSVSVRKQQQSGCIERLKNWVSKLMHGQRRKGNESEGVLSY